MNKPSRKRLDTSDLALRLADCRGALKQSIEGILTGDPDQIDAAVDSLNLAERELWRLVSELDIAELARAGKASQLAVVN